MGVIPAIRGEGRRLLGRGGQAWRTDDVEVLAAPGRRGQTETRSRHFRDQAKYRNRTIDFGSPRQDREARGVVRAACRAYRARMGSARHDGGLGRAYGVCTSIFGRIGV